MPYGVPSRTNIGRRCTSSMRKGGDIATSARARTNSRNDRSTIAGRGRRRRQTQFFDAGDIENVKRIQSGYRGLTLSKFQNKAAPPAAPQIAWPKIGKQTANADPFSFLNFA